MNHLDAFNAAIRVREEDPHSYRALIKRAVSLARRSGDWAAAGQYAWTIGFHLLTDRESGRALRWFRRAKAYAPSEVAHERYIGIALMEAGRRSEGAVSLHQAAMRGDTEAELYIVKELIDSGRSRRAKDYLENSVVCLRPDLVEAMKLRLSRES